MQMVESKYSIKYMYIAWCIFLYYINALIDIHLSQRKMELKSLASDSMINKHIQGLFLNNDP